MLNMKENKLFKLLGMVQNPGQKIDLGRSTERAACTEGESPQIQELRWNVDKHKSSRKTRFDWRLMASPLGYQVSTNA